MGAETFCVHHCQIRHALRPLVIIPAAFAHVQADATRGSGQQFLKAKRLNSQPRAVALPNVSCRFLPDVVHLPLPVPSPAKVATRRAFKVPWECESLPPARIGSAPSFRGQQGRAKNHFCGPPFRKIIHSIPPGWRPVCANMNETTPLDKLGKIVYNGYSRGE